MCSIIYTVGGWSRKVQIWLWLTGLAFIDSRKKKTCPEHLSCLYVSWRSARTTIAAFVMESQCSFFRLVGGISNYDKRYLSGDTVPLSWCDRSIKDLSSKYVTGVGISDWTYSCSCFLICSCQWKLVVSIKAKFELSLTTRPVSHGIYYRIHFSFINSQHEQHFGNISSRMLLLLD